MADSIQNSTDFAPSQIATTVSRHDEKFILVESRLDNLENRFGSNEKIADTLCETAEKASKMNEMLSKSFIKLLQHDVDIKEEIKNLIDKTDRQVARATIKKYGGFVGTIIWTIATLILGAYLGSLWK